MALREWIIPHSNSPQYIALSRELATRKLMSSPAEVAMMAGIVEHLKPDLVLEIGTFFGKTARALAEAITRAGCGKLITIDPFGRERVPDIIAAWPEDARAVTEFRPEFSMEFFSGLEAQAVRGKKPPRLGLVFVDGNHSYPYALFDIQSAAVNMVPGGAIVVDNIEQYGPRQAVLEFLRRNQAWHYYRNGQVYDARVITEKDLYSCAARDPIVGAVWGVLLAPEHIQIANGGSKWLARLKPNCKVRGLTFNVRLAGRATDLTGNILYICRPKDFHVSGTGAVVQRRNFAVSVEPGAEKASFVFDPPISVDVPRPVSEMNFTYQIEVAAGPDLDSFVLLDGEAPYELDLI